MAEVVRCGSSRILGTGACGLVSLLLHCVKLVLGIGQGTRGRDVPRPHLRLCDGVIKNLCKLSSLRKGGEEEMTSGSGGGGGGRGGGGVGDGRGGARGVGGGEGAGSDLIQASVCALGTCVSKLA